MHRQVFQTWGQICTRRTKLMNQKQKQYSFINEDTTYSQIWKLAHPPALHYSFLGMVSRFLSILLLYSFDLWYESRKESIIWLAHPLYGLCLDCLACTDQQTSLKRLHTSSSRLMSRGFLWIIYYLSACNTSWSTLCLSCK